MTQTAEQARDQPSPYSKGCFYGHSGDRQEGSKDGLAWDRVMLPSWGNSPNLYSALARSWGRNCPVRHPIWRHGYIRFQR